MPGSEHHHCTATLSPKCGLKEKKDYQLLGDMMMMYTDALCAISIFMLIMIVVLAAMSLSVFTQSG